ncbi:MAG: 2-succinyl-5-enolpyruvyl-6-hydroxy-3-cyclohexene-1-carboxylate synthase, partial [FCB group bacterium]|nr:2-succinyl-5-enolpyruvyl-6-hydroxy-3-cyclohexene-1-carboxylate synthase [FCB group bacterium]
TGLGQPVTLLIGDLTFLHDLNSLALLNRSPQPISVVVLNNNGGGIFQHLPVAGVPDVFEKYFVTPHGLNFAHAARMFDLPYCRVEDMAAFTEAFDLSQQSESSSIIEITLDRKQGLSFHQSVQNKIVAALEGLI